MANQTESNNKEVDVETPGLSVGHSEGQIVVRGQIQDDVVNMDTEIPALVHASQDNTFLNSLTLTSVPILVNTATTSKQRRVNIRRKSGGVGESSAKNKGKNVLGKRNLVVENITNPVMKRPTTLKIGDGKENEVPAKAAMQPRRAL